jgi:hypothetical protein
MTIQSRINSMNTTPTLAGMTPSEWTAKSLKKKIPKERTKIRNSMDPNQLPCSQTDAAKHLYHHVVLYLALSPRKFRTCKPRSHNHYENVNNFKNYSVQI